MLQAYKVPQFDKRLAREIEFRGGEGTIDQTSYVAPEALRKMMKRYGTCEYFDVVNRFSFR